MKKSIVLILLMFASSCCPKIPLHIFDGTEKYYGTVKNIDYVFHSLPNLHPSECMLIHTDSGMFRLFRYDLNIKLKDTVWIHQLKPFDFNSYRIFSGDFLYLFMIPMIHNHAVINEYSYPTYPMK